MPQNKHKTKVKKKSEKLEGLAAKIIDKYSEDVLLWLMIEAGAYFLVKRGVCSQEEYREHFIKMMGDCLNG